MTPPAVPEGVVQASPEVSTDNEEVSQALEEEEQRGQRPAGAPGTGRRPEIGARPMGHPEATWGGRRDWARPKPVDCTTPNVNPDMHYRLWVTAICRFIDCNKCPALLGDVDNGGGIWEISVPFKFAVNLKLL